VVGFFLLVILIFSLFYTYNILSKGEDFHSHPLSLSLSLSLSCDSIEIQEIDLLSNTIRLSLSLSLSSCDSIEIQELDLLSNTILGGGGNILSIKNLDLVS